MQKSTTVLLMICAGLAACSNQEAEDTPSTGTTIDPLPTCATIITVSGPNALRDECLDVAPGATCSVVNGNCSVREAFLAATRKAAFDGCPAPVTATGASCTDSTYRVVINIPAGTTTLGGAANENDNNGGDLDWWFHSVEVNGPAGCDTTNLTTAQATCWTVNANNIDRCWHMSGGAAASDSGLSNAACYNGCANGGDCNTTGAGGTPFGGGAYFNSPGRLRVTNVLFANSRSLRGGSGFATCTDSATDFVLTDVRVTGCSGSSAVQSHTATQFTRLNVTGNTMTVNSSWGAVDIYNRVNTLTDSHVDNNVNTNGDSAGITVRGTGSSARGELRMTGGSINGNIANGKGAGLLVSGGPGCTNCASGSSCMQATGQSYGCLAVLTDVQVNSNTTDSPVSAPAGSGGGFDVNGSGTAPGRLELRGASLVASNNDSSMAPTYGPDCAGPVSLFDQSSVGNTSGCTIDDHRTCGNGTVEAGEQCDSTPCCTPSCAYAAPGSACSDGNACTLSDACNAIGQCLSAPGCGNGILQSSCGETCDDGNTTNSDGCHDNCQLERCTGWTYP